jgi:uncharacterized protein
MDTRSKSGTGLAQLLLIVAIIGALNWGLVGFFNWNLVDAIFGGGASEMTSSASRVVYALVGLAGVALLLFLPKLRVLRGEIRTRAALPGTRREVHP